MEHLDRRQYWDNIYQNRQPDEVSWFQPTPVTSLDFIKSTRLSKKAAIIDIGGGESFLVDHLLDEGFKNITVLDVSDAAIRHGRQRVGENGKLVKWIVTDIVDFEPEEKYDLWHDRATFHFLTNENDIEKYRQIVRRAVKPKGYMVIGTFSDMGPQRCSGLEIHQYSESSMIEQFSADFELLECTRVDHLTPYQTVQNFLFCCFRKRAGKAKK